MPSDTEIKSNGAMSGIVLPFRHASFILQKNLNIIFPQLFAVKCLKQVYIFYSKRNHLTLNVNVALQF